MLVPRVCRPAKHTLPGGKLRREPSILTPFLFIFVVGSGGYLSICSDLSGEGASLHCRQVMVLGDLGFLPLVTGPDSSQGVMGMPAAAKAVGHPSNSSLPPNSPSSTFLASNPALKPRPPVFEFLINWTLTPTSSVYSSRSVFSGVYGNRCSHSAGGEAIKEREFTTQHLPLLVR